MLILTRRVGEAIKIGDDIEVTVVQVSGDQVRLGVKAPRHVQVYRTEVLEQIAQENIIAAQTASHEGDVEEMLEGGEETKRRKGEG